MSLTELALLEGRRPLPLGDVMGLTLTLTATAQNSVSEYDIIFLLYRKSILEHIWRNYSRYRRLSRLYRNVAMYSNFVHFIYPNVLRNYNRELKKKYKYKISSGMN
jgi:hypothetical protein